MSHKEACQGDRAREGKEDVSAPVAVAAPAAGEDNSPADK
jgi:hypothetical protein